MTERGAVITTRVEVTPASELDSESDFLGRRTQKD